VPRIFWCSTPPRLPLKKHRLKGDQFRQMSGLLFLCRGVLLFFRVVVGVVGGGVFFFFVGGGRGVGG